MKDFDYKDSFVAVREYHTGILPDKLQRTCFCCGKKINNCKSTLLINNYKYIPNMSIHSDCLGEIENKTNDEWNDLCDDIYSKYMNWKELDSIFGSFVE